MNTAYQPIHDAVSREVQGLSFAIQMAQHSVQQAAVMYEAAAIAAACPHVLMRPKVYVDGNKWCALYGENLQEGVSGFGDSPAVAMAAFDAAWIAKLPQAVQP